jgi:hypothetical protein
MLPVAAVAGTKAFLLCCHQVLPFAAYVINNALAVFLALLLAKVLYWHAFEISKISLPA